MGEDIYQFNATSIKGQEVSLETYKDKVVIIVNTASKCGLTPQYTELEEIFKQKKDQGLVILGFPCNQFGKQEPGSDDAISSFCQVNYGVSFPMFSKIEVNGKEVHPLFQYLKNKTPGFLGTKSIKWNFTKFLIDRNGMPIRRFAPKESPKKMLEDIEKLL